MTVVLSINLCTKYCDGVPLDNLPDKLEYVDLSIFVIAESDCVVCVLFCLNVASRMSAIPKVLEPLVPPTVTEDVPSALDLKKVYSAWPSIRSIFVSPISQ